MSALDNQTEGQSEFVFGSRTIFVPGRSVEIGFAIRKKSSFPLVEELMLKLLNTVGGASLEDITSFVAMPAIDLQTAFQPLVSRGLIILSGNEFRLSEVGKMLFAATNDGTPAITESETRVNRFTVDDPCALPILAPDLSEHHAKARGGLKWLIDDLPGSPITDETVVARTRRNFSEHFAHFMRHEGDLEKMRDEQLELHKTEYAKTKSSLAIQADIQGVIRKTGVVVNRVIPFDTHSAKTDSRSKMRAALIDASRTPVVAGTEGEVEFLRNCFGEDFLAGIVANGGLPWFKVMPRFFAGNHPNLGFGNQLVIGEACVSRNLMLLEKSFERASSGREFSPESPLRIAWLRPSVESWGRSIAFLDGIRAFRELSKKLLKGAVVLELWENRFGSTSELTPKLNHYWPWFDDIRVFRSQAIPSKMELVLVGDGGGVAVTHAYTPPQACFPCPIGVWFDSNERIDALVSSEVEPNLRSLPKPQKHPKNMAKKGNAKGG